MFQFKNKNILILSPEDWGTNQLSKHLYAKELSKNNTVYFLHTVPHPAQNTLIKKIPLAQNLYLLHTQMIARGIFKLPAFFVDFQNKKIIQEVLKTIGKPIDVVWSFDQSKFQNLKAFNAGIRIFHPVDYILKAKPFVSRIADSAQVVLSVSNEILKSIETQTPKYFLNHGVDEFFFKEPKNRERPVFIKQNSVNVGYVGNLQMKLIDYPYLIKTVKENPEVQFVFMGPYTQSNLGRMNYANEINELKNLPNTYFTGELLKEELVDIFPFIDAFWICYNQKEYPIEVSNSHKILEYLSTGKTVISSFFALYQNISNDIMVLAKNNEMFPALLKSTIQQLPLYNAAEKQEQRINFAKENTYAEQIKRIENILNNLKMTTT
ncbi:MAG: hypothetical protein HUU48_00645 [Flavobacteriales bacterium]|nr:hypothetical protein [Flavobacteriales bacterium]